MTTKLVIWDVDGTLVDSQEEITAAMTAAFEGAGRPAPTRAATLSIVGLSLPVAIAELDPSLDEAQIADLTQAYKNAFYQNRLTFGVSRSPLFSGMRAVLDNLRSRADIRMAIATGKTRRGLDALIKGHGLEDYFVSTQVSDHHPSKPHPAMVLAALEETGIAAKDAVMIGDTRFDMDMARAAGVAALGVTWGYHPSDQIGADALAQTPADLPGLIDQLTGQSHG